MISNNNFFPALVFCGMLLTIEYNVPGSGVVASSKIWFGAKNALF